MWQGVSHRHPAVVIGLVGVITGVVGASAMWFFLGKPLWPAAAKLTAPILAPAAVPGSSPARVTGGAISGFQSVLKTLPQEQDHGYSIYNRWWTHCHDAEQWRRHFTESEIWRTGIIATFRTADREDLVNEFNLPRPTDTSPETNVRMCPNALKLIEHFHRVNRLGEIIRRARGPEISDADAQGLLEKLAAFREDGTVRILNGPSSKKSAAQFDRGIEEWKKPVVQTLKDAGRIADAARFQHLVEYALRGLGGLTPEHSSLRDIVAEHLSRLTAIMDEIQKENIRRKMKAG